MKIKYSGRFWEVVETKQMAGGGISYGIEDEPNHIDWICNPESVVYGNEHESLAYYKEHLHDMMTTVHNAALDVKDDAIRSVLMNVAHDLAVLVDRSGGNFNN